MFMAMSFKDSLKKAQQENNNISIASLEETSEAFAVYDSGVDELPYSDAYQKYTEYADTKFSIVDEDKNTALTYDVPKK